ncbi:MAG: alginate lyase family protein [Acidimicrobiales bacterium]
MAPDELAWRVHDQLRQQTWRRRQVRPSSPPSRPPGMLAVPRFCTPLRSGTREALPAEVRAGLVAAADELLAGRWEILGVMRTDIVRPDWFFDPVTGLRAPQEKYAFSINHRSEAETGNVKQIWELSRLHHLTLLAAAWFASEDGRYAEAVEAQLRSWWAENPFLSGIHWTSGIELAERLISWVWVRRLLDGWPRASALFEANVDAQQQVYWHQHYLANFRSRGSSANNHVIAEAAGQLIASCAFDWFETSAQWRMTSASLLRDELDRNTFPSGLNREQASEYHAFVTELGLLAAAECDASDHPLGVGTWRRLTTMLDAGAAVLDERGGFARQGDGDDGRALLVDPPAVDRWDCLLATGAALVHASPWWPPARASVMSVLVEGLGTHVREVAARPAERVSQFSDAGMTLLRSKPRAGQSEIWCRCDGGPHGFLSIAAHAHADALSLEVRYGGVDVLADPGTYCYHGEPAWRRYFRSTLAHNTLEVAGEDQSVSGGPFLWLSSARASGVEVGCDDEGRPVTWSAQHDGYVRLTPPALHHRSVSLDERERRLDIVDRLDTDGEHPLRLAFHLGPAVQVDLRGALARLRWSVEDAEGSARFELPSELNWTEHRGETEPILGWYSRAFGTKEPSVTLLGEGRATPGRTQLLSSITFSP